MIVLGRRLVLTKLFYKPITQNLVIQSGRNVSTIQVTDENAIPINTEIPLSEVDPREKQIDITTCGLLFEKWRKEKRYWKVPKTEIPFRIRYIDTGYQGCAADTPTVVALPGSPGSYKDFDPLTELLNQQGVRVISLNFPGWEVELTSFRSTPEEKSELVSDFLQALRVPRVDLMVCHSSAMFPGLFLCTGNRIFSPKSLVLLNPSTLEIPRLLHPPWLIQFLVRSREFPVGRTITDKVGRWFLKKSPVKTGTFEEHFQAATCIMNAHIPTQTPRFQALLDQNYPILMAFSNNDKLIGQRSLYKMAKMMVNVEEIEAYDKEGRKKNPGGSNPFRRVISFENGTHYLLKTYPDIVSQNISSFLFQHLNNRVNEK